MIIQKPSKVFYGTLLDTKPTDSLVPAGSLFFETDTKDIYLFGNGSWLKISTGGAAHVLDGVIASNGALLPLDSLAQTLAYNADGTLDYVEVTHDGTTYRQTMSYTDGELTGVSAWGAQ